MKEINLISVFLVLTIAILTVEGHGHHRRVSRWNRKPGSHSQTPDDDDDDSEDLENEHSPPNTDQSLPCSYQNSTGNQVLCNSGCCLDDSRLVCCGTSEDTDKKTDHENKHFALFVILGLLPGLLVGFMATFVVFKLCKSKKTPTRRTTPLPDNVLPVKPPQTRQKPPRPQRKNEPMNSVFTVTPVLPSYADVTPIAESNRPPPEYSAGEPTFGSGYLRSFASPPPPYQPNGLETTD